jgi:histidinol phosphatase-like PHP family hydrolase
LRILRRPDHPPLGGAAYLGDLQMHTAWSDGASAIGEMAAAAAERGQRYIAVTDHSFGLPIAGGIGMDEASRQHAEIDAWNRSGPAIRVLKGIEANIDVEGGLDLTLADRTTFEIVVAAPHSRLRRAEDQTARMRAAVRQPGLHVLGHPRGRMRSRQGILARWEEVFAEAAEIGVAIELDGDPYRQDLDWESAGRALAAGCLFALDSDAHATEELLFSRMAVAHARRAGIPPDRVINCWTDEQLVAWMHRPERSR